MDHIDVKNLKPGDKLHMKLIVQVSTYGFLNAYSTLLDGSIKIADTEITVTVPEGFNPTAAAVAALDRQMEIVHDEASRKIAPLQRQKDQLLQLTYQGQEILDPEKPE